ncbi:MAG: hypothetical protein JNK19_16775 [Tabrizicola sp.]|nr:hypothetical protein [Tabrizicola sp.]
MTKSPERALEVYSSFMQEIKERVNVISRALEKHANASSLTGYRESDIELCLLQLRKCFELVMLASITAHYHRGIELQNKLVQNAWNATTIMKFLGRVNPEFFPKALSRSNEKVEDAWVMVEVDGALTKEEFGVLYDRVCGKYLHASRDRTLLNDHDRLFKEIGDWLSKLTKLLSSHWVKIDEEIVFAVLMQTDATGDVQVALFERLPTDQKPKKK